MLEDALSLGIKHATLNVNLSQVIAPGADSSTDCYTWNRQGQKYAFHKSAVDNLDQRIGRLSRNGVMVYLILLVYHSPDETVHRILSHPGYDRSTPNHIAAFNTVTDEGTCWLAATLEFMADRWTPRDHDSDSSRPRVVGYIVGNEVNSHWYWSNRGRATMQEFTRDYHKAVRTVHAAVRKTAAWPRVYVSLDHHWNIRYPGCDERQGFPGKAFLEEFTHLARSHGDFDWHVAFHPYPENLADPRFWKDRTAIDSFDTPRITFRNLHILTKYLDQPAMRYAGQARRVILSEQGFHASHGREGEQLQAAAFCYAYRIVERLNGIDAFILHRHVDHQYEGGLQLGLWTRRPGTTSAPQRKRLIYQSFQAADQPDWERQFAFALPIIGLDHWPEKTP